MFLEDENIPLVLGGLESNPEQKCHGESGLQGGTKTVDIQIFNPNLHCQAEPKCRGMDGELNEAGVCVIKMDSSNDVSH